MIEQCKAITKSGNQCKHKANDSGFCHIHDPEKIAERKEYEKLQSMMPQPPKLKFSQRKGFKPVSEIIQLNTMSVELRNSLWNVISRNFLRPFLNESHWLRSFYITYEENLVTDIWANYFKEPIDFVPSKPVQIIASIFKYFDSCEWFEVYDFVEYLLNRVSYVDRPEIIKELNHILEQELAGYRFVGEIIIDITDEQEIQMLENALGSEEFPATSNHLKRALSLLSDREHPDYRNSIKESISAVEALAREITGNPKATLGQALSQLEKSKTIHPSLKSAFSSLYGYTSDQDGIRHAMLDEPNLSASDAKFFLLTCTSFINYLKSKI